MSGLKPAGQQRALRTTHFAQQKRLMPFGKNTLQFSIYFTLEEKIPYAFKLQKMHAVRENFDEGKYFPSFMLIFFGPKPEQQCTESPGPSHPSAIGVRDEGLGGYNLPTGENF